MKKYNHQIKRILPQNAEVTALEITGIVLDEPVIKEWTNGNDYKAKTMFKAQSLDSGKIIDFVVWKKFNVKQGDTFKSVGKIEQTQKAFIGWADLTNIIKRA